MPNKKRRGGSDTKHAKGSSKGGGGGGTLTNNKTEKKPVKTDKNRHDLDDNKSNTERRRTYSNNKKTSNNTTTTNNSSSNCDEVDATVTIRHDVVVNLNNRTAIVSDVKRYSDSFIQAGCNKIDKIDGNLSRSRSGFLTDDDKESPKSDKSDRKSRRFSDIFRYGAYRTDLDVIKNQEERKKMISSSSGDTKKGKINNTVKSATGNRNLAMVGGTPNKPEKTLSTCSDSNNSYLKRVKSKICRTRTDDPSTIYENDENLKQRNNLRSSVSHFDFRLIRQTSNLEKVVRPSVLGHKKCASNVGVGETISDEKPVLAKSKSSSAINLGLLRTRRNKILEQIKKNVKPAENEFDFIAFTRTHRDKNDFIEESVQTTLPKTTSSGDMKPNQSLTRTDSDRRPDAKNENTSQGSQEHIQNDEESVTTMENTKSLPPFTDKKKNASSINRSESVKESSDKQKNERKQQRRNISDPLHNTSESGTIDSNDLPWSGSTGSSSNTSINSNSRYSNESPTGGNGGCDSDGNNETDYLDWQSGLPEEELQKLSSHEKERQDIINELFYTEKSHLRNLDILSRIFLKGIKEKSLLKEEEIQLIFPNLPDLLKIHGKFKCILKNKKIRDGIIWKNIGESLLTMFEGELGETLQKVAATFCENQQCALELIKEKRRKDSKFSMGLNELEKNNDCRRLTLQGFIVSEMQRLAKYPLLIERLISILEKIESNSQDLEYSQVEMNSLTRAHDRAKEIINYINEAAAKAWCKYRLEEIQNHLDTSLFSTSSNKEIVNEFKSIDLTNYNYVYDGPVHLKRQNKAHLQVHMVLLEEFVVLLQRDSERYLLKFFQNGKPGQPPLAPIIKMSTLLVRTNAAFESSLFLVNTSASSMYELLTRDSSERKTWFTHLSNAVESFKQPGGKTKTSEPDEEETVDELPNLQDAIERAETIGSDTSGSDAERNSSSSQVRSTETNNTSSHEDDESTDGKSDITVVEKNDIEINDDVNSNGGGVSRKFTTEDWPLIQPSEVHADIPPVHSADIVLTPIEQIKRKGDEVSKAIDEKQNLCADVLNIDRKDFKIIADMTSEANTRDPIDLVIASMNQVDLIFKAVNESLTVTDAELIKGGTTPSCTSQKNFIQNDYHRYPSEMNDVKEAATKLNRLLTELLEVVKDKDEEYLRLRREQEKTREQLHARLSLECSSQEINKDVVDVSADVSQTGDLESIEESLTENDMN